jgi:DNA-nicking Smr family endonuclease
MTSDDGKRRRRRLSEEERTLWGSVIRSVLPLRRKRIVLDLEVGRLEGKANPGKPAPKSVQKPTPRDAPRHAPKAESKVEPKYQPPAASLDRRQKRRLARGTEPIDARIDLHGRTQNEAHAALLGFLRAAQRDGAKFVLVITGKGLRGDGHRSERGVLKRQVPHWLQLPEFRAYVLSFEQAHVGHGGEGALYVRLRRSSKHA